MSDYGANGWGQLKENFELDLPSGAKVLMRELEVTELINLGVLDIIDKFTQLTLPNDASESAQQQLALLAERSDDFKNVFQVVGKICRSSVVKPTIEDLPAGEQPIPGHFYAHLIPFADQLAIFEEAVDGMSDLFQSGEGQAETVAALPDVEDVEHAAKSAPRNTKVKNGT